MRHYAWRSGVLCRSLCHDKEVTETALPKLIAFDLDDTLAPSKSRVPDRILKLLEQLLERTTVAVISGGAIHQFQKQLLQPLAETGAITESKLERLHILPTCGTHYERFAKGSWNTVYRETLSPEDRSETLTVLREEAERLGLWEKEPWGEILEDRGSQVTFSALGQRAPVAAKEQWDPRAEKKDRLRDAVAARLPHLEVRSGGSTSVDVTRKGIDKAYGMAKLREATGIGYDDMLFIGDRLDPAGNDYPVKTLGIPTIAVTGWQPVSYTHLTLPTNREV